MAQFQVYETCMQEKTCCSIIFPLLVLWGAVSYHTSSRTKAMTTGARPSLIGDLTALTARLDGLCTSQNPEDLSSTLRTAFEERELYNLYISFPAADEKRAKALLEVFDKVCLRSVCHSVKCFSRLLHDTGSYGPGI